MTATQAQEVRVLIVDDEQPMLEALVESVSQEGYRVQGVIAAEDALDALRTGSFEVLLTDLMMPGMGGMALVREALRIDDELICLVMTGHGSVDAAVKAMKSGASDFIVKPFNASTLVPTIARALTIRRLRQERASFANALAQRTAQLQAANRELDAFVHSVSHDLRAPLAAIAGFSELLDENWAELSEERARHLVGRIRANAWHMGSVVDDLLRLSRISRGELERVAIDLSAMAAEIVAELRLAEPGRAVEVHIEPGLEARGDRGLVRLAVENLLANAWKYTARRADARIELRCERDPGSGSPVYVVQDNGVGFDMAYADNLFRPFHRLHSDTEFPGSGIGLSIVRRVVERHEGRIWVEAVEGRGASFRLTLGHAGAGQDAA